MNNDWNIIQKKEKKNNLIKNKFKNIKTYDEIKKIIVTILSKYKILYIFIYGSRARGTNKIDSDVDIMCFMKYPIPKMEILSKIKKELIQSLDLNVDFVIMQLTNKQIKIIDDRTRCYYDNVLIDGKCIYSSDNNINLNLNDLIDKSIKLEKIE